MAPGTVIRAMAIRVAGFMPAVITIGDRDGKPKADNVCPAQPVLYAALRGDESTARDGRGRFPDGRPGQGTFLTRESGGRPPKRRGFAEILLMDVSVDPSRFRSVSLPCSLLRAERTPYSLFNSSPRHEHATTSNVGHLCRAEPACDAALRGSTGRRRMRGPGPLPQRLHARAGGRETRESKQSRRSLFQIHGRQRHVRVGRARLPSLEADDGGFPSESCSQEDGRNARLHGSSSFRGQRSGSICPSEQLWEPIRRNSESTSSSASAILTSGFREISRRGQPRLALDPITRHRRLLERAEHRIAPSLTNVSGASVDRVTAIPVIVDKLRS